MATYYVAATGGNNGNAGTSVGAPWATLIHAIDSGRLAAGDTLNIRGGLYREFVDKTTTTTPEGTSGSPITIQAYQNERPLLMGSIHLRQPNYVKVRGLNAIGDPNDTPSTNNVFRMLGGTDWEVSNGEIWNSTDTSCLQITSSGGQPQNWLVENMVIHDNVTNNAEDQDHCIYLDAGQFGTIRKCVIYNTTNGRGIKIGSGSAGGPHPTDNLVEYCTVYNVWGACVSFSYDSADNIVENCILQKEQVGGTAHPEVIGLFEQAGTGNIVRNNIWWTGTEFVENDDPIISISGNTESNPRLRTVRRARPGAIRAPFLMPRDATARAKGAYA